MWFKAFAVQTFEIVKIRWRILIRDPRLVLVSTIPLLVTMASFIDVLGSSVNTNLIDDPSSCENKKY